MRSALRECQIEPALVELELSERGVLSNVPSVLDQLHELRALGVPILVDDFGTGDSSITYLRRLLAVARSDQLLLLTADAALIALAQDEPGLPVKSV